MIINDFMNFKNEKENIQIYSIEINYGNYNMKYTGKIIENKEYNNQLCKILYGYIVNSLTNNEYLLHGIQFEDSENFNISFINVYKDYIDFNMYILKNNDEYILKSIEYDCENVNRNIDFYIEDAIIRINKDEYNAKSADKTKRKVLNYYHYFNNRNKNSYEN